MPSDPNLVRVPHIDTVENGNGMVSGYCSLWRAVFKAVAERANAHTGSSIELKDIKKLSVLSAQIIALTDLKRIKEQFANYKDAMAEILSRKGKIPKEDILSLLDKMSQK